MLQGKIRVTSYLLPIQQGPSENEYYFKHQRLPL